ncbi:recombinase family protein [Zophobihabitans entericus]|uniref:Recombinase family protein n=1 Tax=Zophobihabitans entericus TaxID=1635327 RepID=A0A6G9IFC8_9GAMM|nr:recombinase family protein [Zophobihabitans entericus]QIQ22522.1 recombinase family protein [Zophobihabitans entericus]
MLIGYARVSTNDQDLTLQIDALQKNGCDKIFTDKISGSKTQRPGLTEVLNFIREGDSLVVWKLDRLGRTMKGLIDLIEELNEKKIEFISLTDGIDTKGATGKFFFHVMAAFAEMERELNRERTLAGLEVARKAGKTGGRPKAMTTKKLKAAKKLLLDGMPPKDVAQSLGISLSTLYRYCPASDNY